MKYLATFLLSHRNILHSTISEPPVELLMLRSLRMWSEQILEGNERQEIEIETKYDSSCGTKQFTQHDRVCAIALQSKQDSQR